MGATMAKRRRKRPLTARRRALCERFVPFALALAAEYHGEHGGDRDDLDGAALLALAGSARRWDRAVGVKFSTFAAQRIGWALWEQTHTRVRDVRTGRRPGAAVLSGGNVALEGAGVALNLTPEPPVGSEAEEREQAELWLAALTEPEAALCRLVYLDGLSQGDAAARLGLTRPAASELHRSALAKLNGAHPGDDG